MHRPGERLSQGGRVERYGIASLSIIGVADSLYMLAYNRGLINSLACPFFGEGCNIVGRSEHAKHFGIPNAAFGAIGYAAMAILSLWQGNTTRQLRLLRPISSAAIALSAFIASVYLTWEQATKVRAWCFWCLLSAALNVAILPLALHQGYTVFKVFTRR